MRLLGAVRKGDAGERIGMVDTALFSRAERKAEDLAGRQAGKADLRLLFELLQIVLTDLGVEDVPVDEHRSALLPFLKDLTPAPMGEVPERSEVHTSELQSLLLISNAIFCLKTEKKILYTL